LYAPFFYFFLFLLSLLHCQSLHFTQYHHPVAGAGGYLSSPAVTATAGYLGQETCLFVYHLPPEADDALLYRLFSPFGAIESVKVVRDHTTGSCKGFVDHFPKCDEKTELCPLQNKGYGFVKMMNVADAWSAMHSLTNYKVGDKFLQVTFKRSTSGSSASSSSSSSHSSASSVPTPI